MPGLGQPTPFLVSEFYLLLKRVKKTGISKTIVMAEGRVVCRILQSHAHRQPLSLFTCDFTFRQGVSPNAFPACYVYWQSAPLLQIFFLLATASECIFIDSLPSRP